MQAVAATVKVEKIVTVTGGIKDRAAELTKTLPLVSLSQRSCVLLSGMTAKPLSPVILGDLGSVVSATGSGRTVFRIDKVVSVFLEVRTGDHDIGSRVEVLL